MENANIKDKLMNTLTELECKITKALHCLIEKALPAGIFTAIEAFNLSSDLGEIRRIFEKIKADINVE